MPPQAPTPSNGPGAQGSGADRQAGDGVAPSPPSISLPKGGGAIRGIGEKFAANPVTGTGTLSVPLATSSGRSGFGPSLNLAYDSGEGNGMLGLGWSLSLPSVTRKTDKGLPRYRDEPEDTFILSGAEDLVPVLEERAGRWRRAPVRRLLDGREYVVERYRPRIEGLFARIERWTDVASGETHWRSITPDNVTTLYGKSAESRIADPHDAARVFSWLICESYDDTGNAIVYEYKAETSDGVDSTLAHEANRTPLARSANRYLKRIRYGNRVSRLVDPDLSDAEWLFEVVLDYGEHDPDNPTPRETRPWSCRHDPLSTCRAGFEVRSYRLCRRVLMFHHFPDEDGVGRDCLVRSSDLIYREDPVASFLESVVQSGYRRRPRGGYLRKSLPPLEFTYSQAVVDDELRSVDPQSLENMPVGLDGSAYRWVDLDGEGMSGVLTDQGGSWFYKPNLGEGHFGPVQPVSTRPALAALGSGRQQLLDLVGDGRLDVVELTGPTPGFFERTDDRGWEPFRPFRFRPDIQWDDPNLRLGDLTGDGLADALIGQDGELTWYASLGEDGFGPAERVHHPQDEEHGPQLVAADRTQAIYLADMSGDGLPDCIRVRNGEVSYWPNLGYGRFGARVTMDNAPWFDEPDQFDIRRVRLGDCDGTGPNDVFYLGRNGTRIYFNRSGNSFGKPRRLSRSFPSIESASQVIAVDLLGNGTVCLVWSSPLPSEAGRPLRFVDLMSGTKPHLLTTVRNNFGAETHIHYAPSTRFYLADRAAGRPWITRLPFPVQVVERVETLDRISRNRFVTRYVYHHGYFDGVEREFRGFGLVEQWDTESFGAVSAGREAANIDPATHVPPVLTRTWFHTGAYLAAESISRLFVQEYWREADHCNVDPDELLLPDTVLPDSIRRPGRDPLPWRLSPDELREAHRALKGLVLRQEVYAHDGSEAQGRPYTVSERNYTVELLQPAPGPGPDASQPPRAVFYVHPREALTAGYERKLYQVDAAQVADPRVGHDLVLAVDDHGNVLRSVSIAYGRRHADPDAPPPLAGPYGQQRSWLVLTDSRYTNAVDQADTHRTPRPSERRAFELLGLTPDERRPGSTNLFGFDELAREVAALDDGAHDLPPERWDTDTSGLGRPARRLIEHTRTRYRRDDLSGPLPLGALEPLGLPFEGYRLAFTPGLLAELYGGRVDEPLLVGAGGYVHEGGHTGWWVPSGQVFYSPGPDDEPAAELAHARRHFFTPSRFRDPFGGVISVTRDRYDLLSKELRDAVGNRVTAGPRATDDRLLASGNDYRVLQPWLVSDANRNRAAVAFDALGMVVGTAVMGKPEESLGDSLDGFDPDLDEATIAAYVRDPLPVPHGLLQQATTRLVYDLFAYVRTSDQSQPQPALVATLARETHTADLAPGQRSGVQRSFSYSDGLGREVQKKVQAEPGPLTDGGEAVDPRWVGTGWTIFNNKGKPVRRYEPFFSASHGFDFAPTVGVSAMLFYDPVERVVATLHPNDTWEKVVIDPWQEASWDVNDTVLLDPRADPDVGGFVAPYLARRAAQPGGWRSWYERRADGALGADQRAAAEQAAAHAGTPAGAWFDALGRTLVRVARNRVVRDGAQVDESYATLIALDVEGNQRQIVDASGRTAMRYAYDLLGSAVYQASMESGGRWILNDAGGSAIRIWNSRGVRIRNEYDRLRRPLRQWVAEAGSEEFLAERTVYGEAHTDATSHNLRGKSYYQLDGAGTVRHDAYDFKGNLLRSTRHLTRVYRERAAWATVEPPLDRTHLDLGALEAAIAPLVEPDGYRGETAWDAHNRPTTLVAPDGSVFTLTYNQANLLERLQVRLRGAAAATPFVRGVEYNARGQRSSIVFGNGVRTLYSYDPLTFRLTRLRTLRGRTAVQDFSYVFDPAGNVTKVLDRVRPTVFFDNAVAPATAGYVYDAVYQLVRADGREHAGLTAAPRPSWDDRARTCLPLPGDGQAMRRYQEHYEYDEVGNLLRMVHGADGGSWTRNYAYAEPSLLDPNRYSNRLSRTTVGGNTEPYRYDPHGNMTALVHLPRLDWDHEDQLRTVDLGGGGRAWYLYDTAGRRVRKVIERHNGTRHKERVYVGGYEVFRTYRGDGATVALERQTVQVLDDQQRIALVETTTVDAKKPNAVQASRTRYQFGDPLGSFTLELDRTGRTITYEEYSPYGATSFQAGRRAVEAGQKRYRYSGKERDDETGLYYFGARYYAAWIGRWVSPDPAGLVDGSNGYRYVKNNPVNATDPAGLFSWPSWRTVAVVAAVVVVGTVVTVATAGAAGPLVVGAVASVGLSGTAATVATGVAVGAISGAIGGAAAGAAGESTRQTVNSRALGLGTEEFSGGRVLSATGSGAATGAAIGVAVGGVAAFATTAASTAAIGAAGKLAQRVLPEAVRSGAGAVARGLGAGARAVAQRTGVQALSEASESLGVRAAQGLYRAGSRGAQAVERFAETGSVAATFRADEASRQAAATSGAAASPAASSAAENAATAGGPPAAQAYFRGTSEGFPGNPGLQKVGITPVSTDPVVATVFATEAETFGRGVVHIATPADLAGVTVSQGSVRAALEAEVAVELLPAEFAARASTTITAAEARTALSNLGVRLPSAIRGTAAADSALRNTPKLTDAQIKEFLDAVTGTPR